MASASNFHPALIELAKVFEKDSEHVLVIIPGSSGKHFAQIVNGAPFAVFLSADSDRPARLEAQARAVAGSRFTYARGRLVLWSRRPGWFEDGADVLSNGDFRHLAIANPTLAPYGRAAREALEGLGLWQSLHDRLVYGENIAQALQFVASGNAELGFLARSQMNAGAAGRGGSGWEIPASLHAPIDQQAVLLRDEDGGRAFLRFLRSDPARAVIRRHGYETPAIKESRFPASACGGRRLHSTACNERTTPLVPLASLGSSGSASP